MSGGRMEERKGGIGLWWGGRGRGRSGRELTGVTRKVSRRYFKGTRDIHRVALGKV